MDFFSIESDTWESTPCQEKFIKKYFDEEKVPMLLKKKSKHHGQKQDDSFVTKPPVQKNKCTKKPKDRDFDGTIPEVHSEVPKQEFSGMYLPKLSPAKKSPQNKKKKTKLPIVTELDDDDSDIQIVDVIQDTLLNSEDKKQINKTKALKSLESCDVMNAKNIFKSQTEIKRDISRTKDKQKNIPLFTSKAFESCSKVLDKQKSNDVWSNIYNNVDDIYGLPKDTASEGVKALNREVTVIEKPKKKTPSKLCRVKDHSEDGSAATVKFSKKSETLDSKSTFSEIDKGNDHHDISGASISDEELRLELQESGIYKEIQKLMKESPFLNPAFESHEQDVTDDDIDSETIENMNGDVTHSDGEREEIRHADTDNDNKEIKKARKRDKKRNKKNKTTNLEISTCVNKTSPSSTIDSETSLSKVNKKVKERQEKKSNKNDENLSDDKYRPPIKKQKKDQSDTHIELYSSPALLSSDLKLQYLRSSAEHVTGVEKSSSSKSHMSEQDTTSNRLRNKALEKLKAAKFRYLNEKFYTGTGRESFTYFQKNLGEFKDYHQGFCLQVSKWPMNPVDKIIADLSRFPKLEIADMGCGDAKIAHSLTKHRVHSFDIVALNESVTACDISKVPLPNDSKDVVVFCLSLMGMNFSDYLKEAHRILKTGGCLKIAEVESRIESLVTFIKQIESLGFSLQGKNVQHKLFVFMDFTKVKRKPNAKIAKDMSLKPCVYKKR